MKSNTLRYLFDANAIRCLSCGDIKYKLGDPNNRLETTQDVIYELGNRCIEERNLLIICDFNEVVYQKMYELLREYQDVRNLLDYFNNKGTGDVGLIAYAIVADYGKLMEDATITVTNDKGVIRACHTLGLTVCDVPTFKGGK